MDRIIRVEELTGILGVSVATVYRWIRLGHIARPVQIGPRAVGWRESYVNAFMNRSEQSDNDSRCSPEDGNREARRTN
jgi:prophage regulatory protein